MVNKMNISNKKIAVIGAGPAGISQLAAFSRAKTSGMQIPTIVCYEKQSQYGGQWNYDWRIGFGEHGESVHSGMYKNLLTNAPKECLFFPDYSFEDHFKFDISSYPPRTVIKDYINGYVNKLQIQDWIRLNTVVRNVRYLEDRELFAVTVYDYNDSKTKQDVFDYVIIANGHFSVPSIPQIEGIERFQGRILHSHEFRDAQEFTGQTVLIVGAGHSGEDIGSHCYKYKCKQVIRSFRSEPAILPWPSNWKDVPLIKRLDQNHAYFIDDTSAEIDCIIFCTGYKHDFPFLEDNLRLSTENKLWINDLYKGIFWENNTNLIYLAMQNQVYTFPLFYAQASYARDVILGFISLPSKEEMKKDSNKWLEREKTLNLAFDSPDPILYQADYIETLLSEIIDSAEFDLKEANQIFFEFLKHRSENMMGFRDQSYASIVTKRLSPKAPNIWLNDFTSDAFEDYIKHYAKEDSQKLS
jgi:trimethylamine monooxygenase